MRVWGWGRPKRASALRWAALMHVAAPLARRPRPQDAPHNPPLKPNMLSLRGRKGGEVMGANQKRGALVEQTEIDRMRPVQSSRGLKGRTRLPAQNPVAVRPRRRVVAGVESGRDR